MIEELPVQEPGIGVFKASGKLTDADYQQFIPRLEELIHEYGKISVLLELEDFHGWEPNAAWDDFKLGLAHPQDFERIAIVGDKAWEHWIALLAKPFTHAGYGILRIATVLRHWIGLGKMCYPLSVSNRLPRHPTGMS